MFSEEYKALKEQLDRIEANQIKIMEQLSIRGDRRARMGFPPPHEAQDQFFLSTKDATKDLKVPGGAVSVMLPGRILGG